MIEGFQQSTLSQRQQFAAGRIDLNRLTQHEHIHKITDGPGESRPASTEYRSDHGCVFHIRVAIQQGVKRSQTDGIQCRAFRLRECLEPLGQCPIDMDRLPRISAWLNRRLRPIVEHVIVREFTCQSRLPILSQPTALSTLQQRAMPTDERTVGGRLAAESVRSILRQGSIGGVVLLEVLDQVDHRPTVHGDMMRDQQQPRLLFPLE